MQSTQRTTAGIGIPPDWTVQTLSSSDGIGVYQENRTFGLKQGSMGASANSFFAANGGTAPTCISTTDYSISRSGHVFCSPSGAGITGAGVGAVNLTFCLPYIVEINMENGGKSNVDVATTFQLVSATVINSTNTATFYAISLLGAGTLLNTNMVVGANFVTYSYSSHAQNA